MVQSIYEPPRILSSVFFTDSEESRLVLARETDQTTFANRAAGGISYLIPACHQEPSNAQGALWLPLSLFCAIMNYGWLNAQGELWFPESLNAQGDPNTKN